MSWRLIGVFTISVTATAIFVLVVFTGLNLERNEQPSSIETLQSSLGSEQNYQKALEYNPPHNHKADLSFIIYLQVPDEIKKENEKMQGVHNNEGPGMIVFDYGIDMPLSIGSYSTLPRVGDILIFPAWLPHYVHAFKSDVERISVSGNIIFKYDKI